MLGLQEVSTSLYLDGEKKLQEMQLGKVWRKGLLCPPWPLAEILRWTVSSRDVG